MRRKFKKKNVGKEEKGSVQFPKWSRLTDHLKKGNDIPENSELSNFIKSKYNMKVCHIFYFSFYT